MGLSPRCVVCHTLDPPWHTQSVCCHCYLFWGFWGKAGHVSPLDKHGSLARVQAQPTSHATPATEIHFSEAICMDLPNGANFRRVFTRQNFHYDKMHVSGGILSQRTTQVFMCCTMQLCRSAACEHSLWKRGIIWGRFRAVYVTWASLGVWQTCHKEHLCHSQTD